MIFFGYQHEESRGRSSIEYSFESYRRMLGQLMLSLDHTLQLFELFEKRNSRLKSLHDEFKRQVSNIPSLWERNENLLRFLTSQKKMLFTYGITTASTPKLLTASNQSEKEKEHQQFSKRKENSKSSAQSAPPSYDSIEQVLIHLNRDWSPKGKSTRENLYEAIIEKLQMALPTKNNYSSKGESVCDDRNSIGIRVLVPGAGLGRLAIEVAARGYSVEANECSSK